MNTRTIAYSLRVTNFKNNMKYIDRIIIFLSVLGHCYPLVIISYPDLIEDYLQRHVSYCDVADAASWQFEADEKKLREICRRSSVSNKYEMLSAEEALKPPDYSPKVGHFAGNQTSSSGFVSFEVDLGGVKKAVNLFPCSRKIHEQSWFIAHGFHEDIYYLFTQKNAETINFEGLIEPSSELDRSLLHDINFLEKSFINTMVHRSKWRSSGVAEKDGGLLCSLNRNQVFRLCSSMYDAGKNNSLMAAISVNYDEHYSVHSLRRICLLNQVIVADELRESPDKYPVMYFRANLLPCSINEDSFHLTLDPVEDNAVYVLEKVKDRDAWSDTIRAAELPSYDGNIFKVKSRIHKVSVLKLVIDMF